MKPIIFLISALSFIGASAQHYTEKISREFTFEKSSQGNAIIVANINGDVIVTGYDGDKIIVEISKSVSGKTGERLEKGKKEIQLGVIDRADTIIFFVNDARHSFGRIKKGKNHDWNHQGWGYDWSDSRDQDVYDYEMDFVIKVPKNVSVMASTINEGRVSVENVRGAVSASNINGSIRLSNLTREAEARTINGDVDVEYASNPDKECRFYSLNGDINAFFRKGLAADLSFESFNGEFYTNVERIQSLPVTVQKTRSGEGFRYKVNGNRYQIGKGGALLDFETFNGNVYLKEQ